MSRKAEIEARARANKGRRLRSQLAADLSGVLGTSVDDDDFLDADATEVLRRRFFEQMAEGSAVVRAQWRGASAEPFLVLKKIAMRSGGQRFLLLHRHDYYTGAVWVEANSVLARAQEIWKVVGEDFCLSSPDTGDGLCLAFDHYADRDEYELSTWGFFADVARALIH